MVAAVLLLIPEVEKALDDDPETIPDREVITLALGLAGVAVVARDNLERSEDVMKEGG